jgi:hypothetical protein
MTLGWLLGWLLTVAALAAVLELARRRDRLGLAFIAVTLLLAGAWVLAKVAVAHDYRDGGGYVDCWPRCTNLQNAVSLGISAAPIAWALLGVFAAVLAALSGQRRDSMT